MQRDLELQKRQMLNEGRMLQVVGEMFPLVPPERLEIFKEKARRLQRKIKKNRN